MLKKYRLEIILIIGTILLCGTATRICGKHFHKETSKYKIIINDEYYEEVPLEDFVVLALINRCSLDEPEEYLKAQSVMIRTYILNIMDGRKQIDANELDLKYKIDSNIYYSFLNSWINDHPRKMNAIIEKLTDVGMYSVGKSSIYSKKFKEYRDIVRSTKNQILIYDGNPILPMFHQLNCGKTRNGIALSDKYKYLKETECKEDEKESIDKSEISFSARELEERLRNKGVIIYQGEAEKNEIDLDWLKKNLSLEDVDQDGYAAWIKFGDTSVKAYDFAKYLSIPSTHLEIEFANDKVIFRSKGIGHGFGLSVNTAKNMAQKGKNYKKILKHFYNCKFIEY